jgi:hypothetical protein
MAPPQVRPALYLPVPEYQVYVVATSTCVHSCPYLLLVALRYRLLPGFACPMRQWQVLCAIVLLRFYRSTSIGTDACLCLDPSLHWLL